MSVTLGTALWFPTSTISDAIYQKLNQILNLWTDKMQLKKIELETELKDEIAFEVKFEDEKSQS